jgi:SAM-dependent methyltransferase
MTSWFDRDDFWTEFAPALFGPTRWEAAANDAGPLLELLGLAPGARVLDLCCGPGRISLELARRGFTVTGVDRTEPYLEEARRRTAAEGLAVEWVREDMRRFRRPAAFDGAVNLFTSFGYFEDRADDLLVARNLHESLRPGGKLVMEMLGREILANHFRERDWTWIDREQDILMLEERHLRPGWEWIDNDWTMIRGGKRVTQSFGHRLYCGSDLAAILREAGFATVELYGSFAGTPYDHQARRLVAVAVKGS